MIFKKEKDEKPVRGTFRFLNIKIGKDNYRRIEIKSARGLSVKILPPNTTEEELRATMLADGFIEIDRNGNPVNAADNVIQNEKARAILEEALQKLQAIGVEAFNQPLVSPVDNTPGWFLIIAKDNADVKSLRALLSAGCDVCVTDQTGYARALDMISALENQP